MGGNTRKKYHSLTRRFPHFQSYWQKFREINIKLRIDFTKYFFESMMSTVTLWKNEKSTLTKIFFRQINSLVIYLFSKCVGFTKFLPKKVISTTLCTHCTVWKLRKFTLTLFWQKFCENNAFTI